MVVKRCVFAVIVYAMHYSVSWSGGKDSTASIILAHLHGLPIDSIVFAEVMFDKNTSGENPMHMEFITRAAFLFKSWGYPVYILRGEKTYLDCFHEVIKRPVKHKEHQGKKHGFPLTGLCKVKRECKIKPILKFYRAIEDEVIQYVGIAIDEPRRLESLHRTPNISLLERYGYTEEMAKKLCENYGLLSPSYELTKRGGCWMCPFAKEAEQAYIKTHDPEAWQTFVALEHEDVAYKKWSIYGTDTLQERDQRIGT